ncbi:MAG TPA: hypothetical protein VEK39_11500 [Solirubrobacterales bacterium]|nr:hypothetical protein [Solirubrobacterales bacterium]
MGGRFAPMLPGWPGGRGNDPRAQRDLADLADAIRDHERTATQRTVPKRPADHALYRRLADVEESPSARRNGG